MWSAFVYFFSFLLKKQTNKLNVFQICNGVDGVAQHRILKRNQQDVKRSEIENVFFFCPSRVLDGNTFTTATAKTHCLYNPVHTDSLTMKKIFYSILEFWLFTNRTDICGCFFFFSLHFCVDWICDSAVENRFCREGDFNGMTSRPLPLHVDMNAAYITRWLKQTLIAGTQVMELHQRFLHVPLILRTGCVFFVFLFF